MNSPPLPPILDLWTAVQRPTSSRFLGGAGGFSGVQLWRLEMPQGAFCLRRWPQEHPSAERLAWIHAVLDHVAARGIDFIAPPQRTVIGQSFAKWDGHYWEVSRWLPGAPHVPSWSKSMRSTAQLSQYEAGLYAGKQEPVRDDLEEVRRIDAAMYALAEFHKAAASFTAPMDGANNEALASGVSPGLLSRQQKLRELLAGRYGELRRAIDPAVWATGAELAGEILALFARAAPSLARELEYATQTRVPLQPCLRDVWSDHVLFVGDKVAGLIDYGAMQTETASADVSRLLGSLAGDDPTLWNEGLAAYSAQRPLTTVEATLVRIFDRTQVLLSGISWIEWIFVERRHFADPARVFARMQTIATRLRVLAG